MNKNRLDQNAASLTANSYKTQNLVWILGGLTLLLLGFTAGRLSALPLSQNETMLIQAQPDNDARELLPLPGQNQQNGLPPGLGEGDCPVIFYQDGQFYQMQPGEPGQEGSPELFPIQPVPGPFVPQQDPNNFTNLPHSPIQMASLPVSWAYP